MRLSLAALTSLLLFILLTLPVALGLPISGDSELLRAVIGLRNEALTFAIGLLTFVSSAVVTGVMMAAFTLLAWRRRRKLGAFWAALAYAGSVVSNIVLRVIVGRLPPDVEAIPNLLPEIHLSFHRFAYPSGHAGTALITFLSLATLVWPHPKWRWLALSLACLVILSVGVGRFYLGVHWPSDVLGGYWLAGFWFCLGLMIKRRYNL